MLANLNAWLAMIKPISNYTMHSANNWIKEHKNEFWNKNSLNPRLRPKKLAILIWLNSTFFKYKLKPVFCFGDLGALIQIVNFFIAVPISDLAQIFFGLILVSTRVIIGDIIDYVCICGRSTCCWLTTLLVSTIALGPSRISPRGLGIYQGCRLTVSRLDLFFSMRLEGFFFFIRSPHFPAISIDLSNTSRRL